MHLGAASFAELAAGWARGFGPRGGLRALWLGSALHAEYQRHAADDPSFRAEVGVTGRLPAADDWTLVVRGRVDGLRRDAERVLVEELKSVRGDPPSSGAWREACRLQAAVYAWILDQPDPNGARRADDARRVEAALVWLRPGAGEIAREPVDWRACALEEHAAQIVLEQRDAWEDRRARRARWRSLSAEVTWPFPERRAGQAEIEAAVARALEEGDSLLAEAPTGSGKSAAVLVPALRHALETGRRLLVLTASGTQQRGLGATLRAIAPGREAIGTRLRAKARQCANDVQLCHEETCVFALDYAAKLTSRGVLEALEAEAAFPEPETVRRLAGEAECCPFEVSLELAAGLPVTIADLNHAIDPAAHLRELDDPRRLAETIFVVDEAHRIPDRARMAFTARLDGEALDAAIERTALGATPAHTVQRELLEALRDTLSTLASDAIGDTLEGAVAFEGDAAALAALDAECAAALLSPAEGGAVSDAFGEQAFALHRYCITAATAPPGAFVSRVGRREGLPFLEHRCLDPSPWLAPLFRGAHAWIGCSATLAPFELHRDLIGLDPDRTTTVRVGSPFPPENRPVVIDASVSTRAADRKRQLPRIARRLSAFCDAVPGNVLVVAPSFAVAEALAARYEGAGSVLRQRPEDDEHARAAVLDELPTRDDLTVFAVAGGALAEAVDLPGDALRAVAVIGPCVPAPDAERALLEEVLEEHFGNGFDAAYAVPGMTRVIQAAGRLVRGEHERGVLALFGQRFLRDPYRSLLPEEWFPGSEPEEAVDDPAEVARRFFAEA